MRFSKNGQPWGSFDTPYNVPHFAADFVPHHGPVPTGAWRAVMYPGGTFARESFIDELAHRAGVDPMRYRLELLRPYDALKLNDDTLDRARLRSVISTVAEKANWTRPLEKKAGMRRGRGIACNVYDTESYIAQVAEVSVNQRGNFKVDRIVCAIDCGQVINPLGLEGQAESAITWGLSAAIQSEITFKNGCAQQTSFRDFPVIRMNDAPHIELHILATGNPPGGFGEHGVPCVAPAVANALFEATGKRFRRLPILKV